MSSRPPRLPPHLKGIFAGPLDIERRRTIERHPDLEASPGLEVLHRGSDQLGRVIECSLRSVKLRLETGGVTTVSLQPGAFIADGRVVNLVRPTSSSSRSARLTASGSVATTGKAQVARPSRIWVEGIHDAELLEKVWGDDLRSVGVVVEPMGGMDDLAARVQLFAPSSTRRLGVLLDHLIDGTKEQREAATVRHTDVLMTGHPFVDVWAAVRPEVAGITRWPDIAMGTPWKEGICEALGAGHPGEFWRDLLGRVNSWTDLDTSLINAVERLIDFVTDPGTLRSEHGSQISAFGHSRTR